MRHAILGPGGVGGLIGACLADAGDTVTMIVRPAVLEQYPSQIRLESPLLGKFSAPVQKAAQAPQADVLWITVKATQLDSALNLIPSKDVAGAVVPLLNGVDHIAALRERFGHDPVVPATIAGETERASAGHIIHRSPFAHLNIAGSGQSRLADAVEKLTAHHVSCRFIDNEATLMWSKLVFLAPFALSTTAFDTTIGRVMEKPEWRATAEAALREACAIANAEGATISVEKALNAGDNLPFDMRSSMQKDVDRGNPAELDAIAGPILRGGARHSIAVPATRELLARIEQRVGQKASA
jgi:2-dehydropantoate 2-reductase